MELFNEDIFNSLLTLIEDAVVFLDDTSCECIHWCNGFKKLLAAGALDIRDVKHSKVGSAITYKFKIQTFMKLLMNR